MAKKTTVAYDPQILFQYADDLYDQAASIIASYTVIGLLVGAGLGYVAGRFLATQGVNVGTTLAAAAGAAVGGLIGFASGQAAAFRLRLEAQRLLVMVRIEENTRHSTASETPPQT